MSLTMIPRFGLQSASCCRRRAMKSRLTIRRVKYWNDCRMRAGRVCVLLDVKIPGLTGPELQGRLAERGFTLPIIFLTGHGDIPTTVQTIKAGAEDFLTKPVTKDRLVSAIERAVARHQATREQRDRLNIHRALIATLTPREREVFDLVVQGRMNKQIAHELGASVRTIKAHRQKSHGENARSNTR